MRAAPVEREGALVGRAREPGETEVGDLKDNVVGGKVAPLDQPGSTRLRLGSVADKHEPPASTVEVLASVGCGPAAGHDNVETSGGMEDGSLRLRGRRYERFRVHRLGLAGRHLHRGDCHSEDDNRDDYRAESHGHSTNVALGRGTSIK